MNKKQIAVITPSRFPGNTGDTTHFSEIVNQLILEGFDVTLICPKNPSSYDKNLEISSDVDIIRIPYVPPRLEQIQNGFEAKHYLRLILFLLAESHTVFWTLLRKKIKNVLIRHHILTIQLPLIIKLLGIRTIADGELISSISHPDLSSTLLRLVKSYEKKVIKFYKFWKINTLHQGELLGKFGFPKQRMLLTNVGVNIERVPKFPIEEIPEHTFGYFGVLERWQGVDILLKGFELLLKKIPNAILYIIGNGSLKKSLEETVNQNNLSSNVIFASVSRKVLWNEYFRKFRIVVIPRPKDIGSADTIIPIKLVESFASKKPTIVTKIAVMQNIPKNCVVAVPPSDPESLANAMKELSMNDEKMKRQATAAFTFATNFDIKDEIKKTTHMLFEGA